MLSFSDFSMCIFVSFYKSFIHYYLYKFNAIQVPDLFEGVISLSDPNNTHLFRRDKPTGLKTLIQDSSSCTKGFTLPKHWLLTLNYRYNKKEKVKCSTQ